MGSIPAAVVTGISFQSPDMQSIRICICVQRRLLRSLKSSHEMSGVTLVGAFHVNGVGFRSGREKSEKAAKMDKSFTGLRIRFLFPPEWPSFGEKSPDCEPGFRGFWQWPPRSSQMGTFWAAASRIRCFISFSFSIQPPQCTTSAYPLRSSGNCPPEVKSKEISALEKSRIHLGIFSVPISPHCR